jgi:hypothetical protein
LNVVGPEEMLELRGVEGGVARLDEERDVGAGREGLDEVGGRTGSGALGQALAVGRPVPVMVVDVDGEDVVLTRLLDECTHRRERGPHGAREAVGILVLVVVEDVDDDEGETVSHRIGR